MSNGIRLLILSDGKPGHVTGSLGVLASIEKLMPVQQVILQVRLRLKFMRHPLRMILNHPGLMDRMPKTIQYRLLKFFYTVNDPQCLETAGCFDWMVSAGGDTSFANAWIARIYDIKNIYCNSLRGLDPSLFTVVLSLRTGQAEPNEIQLELSPAPIDREKIREQGRQFRVAQKLEKQKVWAVLIGGNGAGYRYDGSSMTLLAEGLLALAERHKARLLITTSRRTGLKLEKMLKIYFATHPAVAYATFFNHQPEKVVAKFLGAADVVFCTADSGSMITEALATGKPVYVLTPERAKVQPFYQNFLRHHIDLQHIKQLSIKTLPGIDITQDTSAYFHLLEHDPISELAGKIGKWVKPEPL